MNNNSRKGFTLVELSIVLVIIGLLIGGILVAQSLIGTARIQSLVRQVGQYDAAVANFQTKFNSIPGDSVTVSGGDGNYLIDGNAADTYGGEPAQFWPSLSLSGLKSEEDPVSGYVATPTFNNGFPYDAPNAPKAKAGTNAGILAVGADGADALSFSPATGNINMYIIANCTGTTAANAMSCINSFTGVDAIAVDQKLDDGLSNTGTVRGVTLAAAATEWADLYPAAAASYDADSVPTATTGHILLMRIGAQTGLTAE